MNGPGLAAFLSRHRKLGLDTSVFIYAVEGNPRYVALVQPILAWIEGPRGQAVTSTVTMLELLVQPYRLSDLNRVNQFYALLTSYLHLEWVAPTLTVADRAARLRADHNLKTPDAVQAATHELNLVPSTTVYTSWGKGARRRLRFTKTGHRKIEEAYSRHFVWPGKGPFHPPEERRSDRAFPDRSREPSSPPTRTADRPDR